MNEKNFASMLSMSIAKKLTAKNSRSKILLKILVGFKLGDNAQNIIIGAFIIDKTAMSKRMPTASANRIFFRESLANIARLQKKNIRRVHDSRISKQRNFFAKFL